MSTKNQREQLMYSLIGQVTTIVIVIVITFIYVLPKQQTLSASILETNASIAKYNKTTQDGIAFAELSQILGATKGKEELLAIIKSAPKDTQDAIQKTGSDPYMTWLNNAMNESDDDKKKLAIKKLRLNSILPTLNPISNNVEEETVSMRKYIEFIEKNILKRFGIESSAALGIQNIKYGQKGTDMPEVLGSFDTEISFVATNAGINNMIEYVNNLGQYDSLIDTGSTSTGGAGIMSNPLAMIDSLSLQKTLDLTKPTEENNGRMILRFYVRGSSKTDISFLSENIRSRKEALKKKIETALSACIEKNCASKKEIDAFQRKYLEFTRAITEDTIKQGTELIYSLSSELDSINTLEKEFKIIADK